MHTKSLSVTSGREILQCRLPISDTGVGNWQRSCMKCSIGRSSKTTQRQKGAGGTELDFRQQEIWVGDYFWVQLFIGQFRLTRFSFFPCSKVFSRIIFSVIFRASNRQLIDKEN